MARRRVAVELDRLRQRLDARRAAGGGHRRDRRMEQRGDAVFGEQRERFLGLAQRVAEQHRRFAIGEGVAGRSAGCSPRFPSGSGNSKFGRPKVVSRISVSAAEEIDGLRRAAAAGFEIAGVKQARVVLDAGDVQHRRAGNVARRQQPQPEAIAHDRHMERNRLDPAFRQMEPLVHQRGGHVRAQRRLVAGEVVGMGVGNERPWFRIPWVQPQVELRQVQAALETNFDHAGPRSMKLPRHRQGKPGARNISTCHPVWFGTNPRPYLPWESSGVWSPASQS